MLRTLAVFCFSLRHLAFLIRFTGAQDVLDDRMPCVPLRLSLALLVVVVLGALWCRSLSYTTAARAIEEGLLAAGAHPLWLFFLSCGTA
jgi:hypothetical protein